MERECILVCLSDSLFCTFNAINCEIHLIFVTYFITNEDTTYTLIHNDEKHYEMIGYKLTILKYVTLHYSW